jgi:hypothetical protein
LSFRSPKYKNRLDTINEKLATAVKTINRVRCSKKTQPIIGTPAVKVHIRQFRTHNRKL